MAELSYILKMKADISKKFFSLFNRKKKAEVEQIWRTLSGEIDEKRLDVLLTKAIESKTSEDQEKYFNEYLNLKLKQSIKDEENHR